MTAAPLDTITVLTTKGPLATKRIVTSPNGPPQIEDYGRAQRFSFDEWDVSSFDEMVAMLEGLQHRRRSLLVRGKPADGVDRKNALRRSRPRAGEPAPLLPQPRRWLPLDLDSVPCPSGVDPLWDPDAVVGHVVELLPEEFHGVSVFWSFTSSHGIKPGISIRLFFWLDRPLADWEIKLWLAPQIAEKLIDGALYSAAQAIYTAAPIFVGMADPVPYRCGTWTGHSDAVEVPVIEKPQRSYGTGSTAGTSLGDGQGYAGYRAQIGDGKGRDGFNGPIGSAIAAFIGEAGASADTAWLRADLEQGIREAPRDPALHPDEYVETKVADLDSRIAWTLDREAEKAEAAAEPIEPTYPKPLGSVDAARDVLADAMDRFATVALAWQPPDADEADVPPPVHVVNADIGTGKTRAWRERVAPRLIAAGKHPVLAVPRHRLGDEIVRDSAEAGFTAHVYRGREADDPDAPGEKMCRDLARVKKIEAALGDVSMQACKSKRGQCEFFDTCGYQKQRQQEPDLWIIPHQLLFRRRPAFIKCDARAIDESFHNAALHGTEKPVEISLDLLVECDRTVPDDDYATNELVEVSKRVHRVLAEQLEGRLSRHALEHAYVGASVVAGVYSLEWRRKLEPQAYPGMPPRQAEAECAKVDIHNQIVARLARFWRLLQQTIDAPDECSPWLELRHETDESGATSVIVRMIWREEIHESWCVPTMVMDATMQPEIVRQFFPQMEEPVSASAPMPHAYVRQITDRAMAASMLIPSEWANEKTNRTRRNNIEKVRRFIEVRAHAVAGCVLVVCQQGLETELRDGLCSNRVDFRHFNDITGENAYSDVALVIVIGRTEPSPRDVERSARALFGADVAEVAADEDGNVHWPTVARGIRMRDSTGRRVEGNQHPDPRVEAVRWQICEAGLIQTIGRGRGVNRTAADPLAIDIVTNVCLPIEVDETTTWDAIQPSLAQIMRARGAVPLSYRDMAAAYPDLFESAEGARKAATRENPGQTPIEEYLIGVCPGFLSLAYRRTGSRGPAGRLLYDARKIDPVAWLAEHIGEVTILGEPAPAAPEAEEAKEPAPIDPGVAARRCDWLVDTTGDVFLRCGELIHDGLELCPLHREQRARTLLGPADAATLAPDWLPTAHRAFRLHWPAVLDAAAPCGPPPTKLIPLGQAPPDEIYIVLGMAAECRVSDRWRADARR